MAKRRKVKAWKKLRLNAVAQQVAKYVEKKYPRARKDMTEHFVRHIRVTKKGCWIPVSGKGKPQINFYVGRKKDGTPVFRRGRRLVFDALNGTPSRHRVFSTCGDPYCVNPAHFKMSRISNPQLHKKIVERKKIMEKIRELHRQLVKRGLTLPALEEEFNVSRSSIVTEERRINA